jgi:toluene monooxygenase system ferredoxin subunit
MRSADATLRWVEVASLEDVWEGEMIEVQAGGQAVLLAHLRGGQIVAYQGICPHQEYALAEGDLDEDSATLTCQAHHWQFDLRDGNGVNPSGCSLYRYRTSVEGDTILVGYPDADVQRHHRFTED